MCVCVCVCVRARARACAYVCVCARACVQTLAVFGFLLHRDLEALARSTS
jgi:hypothetical protein